MRVLITGAASGIGRAVAEKLLIDPRYPKASLFLVDRNEAALTDFAKAQCKSPHEIDCAVIDLTTRDGAQRAVDKMVQRFGGVDGIASNAGGVRAGELLTLNCDDFDYGFHLNTRPTWLLGKAAHPFLKKARGAIVATASIAAEHPCPPLGTYSASKAALVMLVRQMAVEWGPDGIRCNSVSPGPTVTGITREVYNNPVKRHERESRTPLGRLGQPEDIAEAILFLLHPSAGHISGIDIAVDGGLTAGMMSGTGVGGGPLAKN